MKVCNTDFLLHKIVTKNQKTIILVELIAENQFSTILKIDFPTNLF
jgi:hypothetical protein